MKKLLFLIPAVALLVGCANTGPQYVRLGVFTTASYAIHENPGALPDVKAGAEIFCAVANGTNVNPAVLVEALDNHGSWNEGAWWILHGALGVWNIQFNSHGTNTSSAQPYVQAVCLGLHDAVEMPLPLASPAARRAAANAAQKMPFKPDSRYPQMRK